VYAIVRSGGRQYRVAAGDTISVDRLEVPVGGTVTLDDVLLVGGEELRVGSPRVDSATVVATVIAQRRGPKVRVFKYKKRKHYRRTRGHRQDLTVMRIETISA
jgi:large subunit ribosomal protein L21